MIIAENFLWLHLPKTGGTSMNRLFRDRTDAGVQIGAAIAPVNREHLSQVRGQMPSLRHRQTALF